jgi:hypothetical protein
MANTFNLGNGNWAQKTEKLLAYNAENDNYKPLPFDFDRGSTATRVNKDGLIETVGVDEPRIDFLNNTKGHLLLEPSRTNLFSNSNLFTSWAKEATVTLTPNYGISPDGTQNSTRMQMSENDSIYVSTTSGLTASVYVKGVQGETIRLSNGSSVIHTLTGQWDRIEVYDSGSVSTLMTINTYLGATARDIELFGAQREAGSYATSYIPTSGSTATRSADSANGAGNSNVINSTEGTLYTEIEGFISTDTVEQNRYITLTNGTSNERVALLLGGNPNQLRAIAYSNTQGINLSFTTSLTDVKQFNKLAVKYKSGDYAFFLNGIKIGSSSETSIFTANTLNDISFDVGGGTQQFRGKVKDLKVYNTALSDSELQALTS